MSTEKTADPLSMEEDAAPQSTEQTTDPLSVEETADPLSLTSLLLPMEDTVAPQFTEQTADPLSLTGILLSTEDTVAPQSMAQTAQPLFWLHQLEALLCERFRELGHQFAQVREEIVTHVANVIADSAEQDSWDARKFTWLMLREWQDNGESPPSCRGVVEFASHDNRPGVADDNVKQPSPTRYSLKSRHRRTSIV